MITDLLYPDIKCSYKLTDSTGSRASVRVIAYNLDHTVMSAQQQNKAPATDTCPKSLIKHDSNESADGKCLASGLSLVCKKALSSLSRLSGRTTAASAAAVATALTLSSPAYAESSTLAAAAHAAEEVIDETDARVSMETASELLLNSPHLDYERALFEQHNQIAANYNNNYETILKYKQPANKSEKCLVASDLLDGILLPNSILFWEGSCRDDRADGFGRVYVISSGRKTFEMLTNFHSDEPQYTTTYYTRNTRIDSRTIYFYGKSNRFQSSGILITESRVDGDLLVGMQTVNKTSLITWQKETSRNSKYVLNIKDYGNYVHFIHDLINTPYRSLAMSYRMTNRTNGQNLGYSFTGQSDGIVLGKFTDRSGITDDSAIPSDILNHVIELNRNIDFNVEGALKNVIEALPVIEAYKTVVCNDSYQNPLCTKMKCKEICSSQNATSPESPAVKELLLRLVDHHNNRPLITYLSKAQNMQNSMGDAASSSDPQLSDLLLQPKNDGIDSASTGAVAQAGSLTAQSGTSPLKNFTVDDAYNLGQQQGVNPGAPLPEFNTHGSGVASSQGSVFDNAGSSFGSHAAADHAANNNLYQAQGPSLLDEGNRKYQPADRNFQRSAPPKSNSVFNDPLSDRSRAEASARLQERIERERAQNEEAQARMREAKAREPDRQSARQAPRDPLSEKTSAEAEARLQQRIDHERAQLNAAEARQKALERQQQQDYIEMRRQGDLFDRDFPVIDFSQVDENEPTNDPAAPQRKPQGPSQRSFTPKMTAAPDFSKRYEKPSQAIDFSQVDENEPTGDPAAPQRKPQGPSQRSFTPKMTAAPDFSERYEKPSQAIDFSNIDDGTDNNTEKVIDRSNYQTDIEKRRAEQAAMRNKAAQQRREQQTLEGYQARRDPLSDQSRAEASERLQSRIDKQRAQSEAEAAERRARDRQRQEEIMEYRRSGDRYSAPSPVIDFSQVE